MSRHWRSDAATSRQLLFIDRRSAGDEQINLDLALLVNQVRCSKNVDGAVHGLCRDVKLRLKSGRQGRDGIVRERDNEIDVDRRSRLAGKRCGDRTADRMAHTEAIEDAGDVNRHGEVIGGLRHRKFN